MGDKPSKPLLGELPKEHKHCSQNQTHESVKVMVAQSMDSYAQCIATFSGGSHESVENFVKQVHNVQQQFSISEQDLKLLIVKKLKGKASEWYHSDPHRINLSTAMLLFKLSRDFNHQIQLNRALEEFKQRKWNWRDEESFTDYYNAKIEAAKPLNILEKDMVGFLINGLNNDEWETQARQMNIQSKTMFLHRMLEEIETRKRSVNMQRQLCMTCYNIGHSDQNCPVFLKQLPVAPPPYTERPIDQLKSITFTTIKTPTPVQNSKSSASALKPTAPTPVLNERKATNKERCYQCNEFGHKKYNCKANRVAANDNNKTSDSSKLQNKSNQTKNSNAAPPTPRTQRSKTVDAGILCKNCYRIGHEADICKFPAIPKGVCHNCGEKGHIRPFCPHLKRNAAKESKKDDEAPQGDQGRSDKDKHILFNSK